MIVTKRTHIVKSFIKGSPDVYIPYDTKNYTVTYLTLFLRGQ